MKAGFRACSLILLSVLASLFIVELLIRFFGLAPGPDVITIGPREKLYKGLEFSYYVHTDNFGLRNRQELEPTGSSRRVLFLGDSFVYGQGVSNDFTFATLTQDLLNHRSAHAWTIINGGVNGTGTIAQQRLLTRIMQRTHVDAVVLFYFVYNDPYDTVREHAQLHGDNDLSKRLKAEYVPPSPTGRIKTWLKGHVALNRFLIVRLATVGTLRAFPSAFFDQCDPTKLKSFEPIDALTRTALSEMRASLNGAGVDFSVVLVHRREVLTSQLFADFARAYNLDPTRYDRWLPAKRIIENVFRPVGVDFFDLRGALERHDPRDLYFAFDGHFNERGHRLVAEEMVKWVVSRFGSEAQ